MIDSSDPSVDCKNDMQQVVANTTEMDTSTPEITSKIAISVSSEPGSNAKVISATPEIETSAVDSTEMEVDDGNTSSEDNHAIFTGFGDDEQDKIFIKVEHKSKTLYDVVQELEAEHEIAIAELFALNNVPIEVPRSILKGIGGSSVYIEKILIKNGDDIKTYMMAKTPRRLPKKHIAGEEGNLVIDEGHIFPRKSGKKKPISGSKSFFSQADLLLLRRPLTLGWIRDVLLKAPDGSAPGQVSYFSPDGTMIRSYKDLSLALTKCSDKALSQVNFSFTARPIGGSKNELIRKPQDGIGDRIDGMTDPSKFKNIPRKRKRPGAGGSLNSSPGFGDNFQMQFGQSPAGSSANKKKRRGARQPPKNTLIEKMQVNDEEGGLFGISALSEIFAGMEKADAERELEEYNRMMSLMAAQENVLEALDPSGSACTISDDGELLYRDEILPCSIRCPGMTGKIPGLQCTRCLCLYHAECLGFPEDIDSTNFLCPNCEGTGTPEVSPSHSPPKDAVYDFVHKVLEIKSPSGTPAAKSNAPSSTRTFQGFGKGISIKKVDSTTSDGSPPNRNRRLPTIPQLTSHNLTITPLLPSFGKGQIPRVPNLSPMNRNVGIPVLKRGRGGAESTVIDTIQVNPQRHSHSLSNRHSLPSQESSYGGQRKRYPIPNFGASFGTVKKPTSNIFRNYPQSVVSVGQRKFIVIPKTPPPNVMEMFEGRTPKKPAAGFGRQKKFLSEVFNYLTVKDLLKVSLVNRAWREEASKPRLWTELRLKNTRIYDVNSFGDFVTSRGTETIDFRKMLGTVAWTELFAKLGSAPSLRTLIVGSKVEELTEIAQKECPHLEIIDYPQ